VGDAIKKFTVSAIGRMTVNPMLRLGNGARKRMILNRISTNNQRQAHTLIILLR
jgi:hypothetical protein